MSRKKKVVINASDIDKLKEIIKDFEIKSASIRDSFCNYSYELLTGVSKGDEINRKGHSEIHNDMNDAFRRLKVHIAIIDGAFKHSDLEDINQMSRHELIEPYYVSGFKITGKEDNKGVVLIGTKWVEVGGTISIETPKIKLNDSKYDFIDDLNDAVILARQEVELYMDGKIHEDAKMPEFDFPEQENEFAEAAI